MFLIKSNFAISEIKQGFNYNVHHKTFEMNLSDLKANFAELVICRLQKGMYNQGIKIACGDQMT